MPAGPSRARVGDGRLDRGAAAGEHRLGDERLVVLQPLLGADLLRPGVRPVDPAERLVGLDQLLRLADGAGEHLRDVLDQVEGEPDGVLELPGVDARHGGVERDQVGHLGDVVTVAAVHPRGGVGQLPLVVEPLQPAAEHTDAALGQLLGRAPVGGALVLVEVGQQQAAVLGAHPDLEAVRRAVGAPVLVGLLDRRDHLADQGQDVALVELLELAERPLAHVAAREDPEQVTDGLDAGRLDDLLGVLAAHRRDPRVPADLHSGHGYSTATSNG